MERKDNRANQYRGYGNDIRLSQVKYSAATINPVFNPVAGTLDFSGYAAFNIEFLFAVINITSGNQILYALGVPGNGATLNSAGNVLTLQTSTAGMNATDQLAVLYDDGAPNLASLWTAAQGNVDSAAKTVLPGALMVRSRTVEDLLHLILREHKITNFYLYNIYNPTSSDDPDTLRVSFAIDDQI